MMRQSVLTAIVGTILLVAAAGPAHAQRRDGNIVGRVLRELDVAARGSHSYVDGHERKHFERAMDELRRFEDRWQRGQWDNGRLDHAIEALSHLADARQLDPRTRRLMAEDANLLRQFRASRRGYNSGPYGYRR